MTIVNDYKNYSTIELLEIINKTLDILYANEEYLFLNKSTERNIVFHFARYFISLLDYDFLRNHNVDCEYNRNKCDERGYKDIKYNYDNHSHIIYPDLILHKRGNNDSNILAIEFKKSSNYSKISKNNDIFKLKALTDCEAEFHYQLGLFIILSKTRNNVKITIYENGKEKN